LAPGHPLARGVAGLVLNHPALFTRVDGPTPVFGFDDGSAVVVVGQLGAGQVVAIADPSVLINRMLELEGNLGFARNLLGHLAAAGGRVTVLAGSLEVVGELRSAPGSTGGAGLVARTNAFLADLSAYVLDARQTRLVAIGLAILVALLAARVLPRRRRIV